MFLILAILLIAIILGVIGIATAVHVLLWVGLVVLVIWLLGFLFRAAEGAGGRRSRWYRW
ncbi:MAG TPA: hydrophobic protein [Streptosporangiaceae bacterium]|jgi:hypothetical protein